MLLLNTTLVASWVHWLLSIQFTSSSTAPLEYFIDFLIAYITFRTLHSSQPAYLLSALHAHHPSRFLRLSNTNCFPSHLSTLFCTSSFIIAAPTIWNSLPLALQIFTSPDTFCHHLKTHYFQQAFQLT